MKNSIILIILVFFLFGCNAGSKFGAELSSELAGTSFLSEPIVGDITHQEFTVNVSVEGDLNLNRTISLLYCNDTDSPACTPSTSLGTFINEGSLSYILIVAGDLAAGDDPGDRLSLRFITSDSDGVTGLLADETLTLAGSTVLPIYRSIGPGNTSALTTGAGNSLTISGDTAMFSEDLAANIGVGDALQYDSSGDGSVDSIAFIHMRLSSTEFKVKDQSGANPIAVTSDLDWSIFRAYTSVLDAEGGNENIGIDAAVRAFETWTGGEDLDTANKSWNLALYADSAETTQTTFDNWTTSADNFVTLFAPFSPLHVGESQRHSGAWDGTKARIQATNIRILYIADEYMIIEGIQFDHEVNGTNASIRTVRFNVAESCTFKGNILKTNFTSTGIYNTGIYTTAPTAAAKIYIINNIVFGTSTANRTRGLATSGASEKYIYNNTVSGFEDAFVYTGTSILKNNIAQNTGDNGYTGSSNAASDYNLSDKADTTGANSQDSIVLNFISPGVGDFRLDESDLDAINTGVDLSTDLEFPFSTDSIGAKRVGVWDLGALTQ